MKRMFVNGVLVAAGFSCLWAFAGEKDAAQVRDQDGPAMLHAGPPPVPTPAFEGLPQLPPPAAEGASPAPVVTGPAADLKALVDGNNAFAIDLYKKLAETKGNVLLSPFSVSSALAIASAGARGDTADEMRKALRIDLPDAQLHPAWKELIGRIKTDSAKGCEIDTSNSFWAQRNGGFRTEFLDLVKRNHHAEVQEVDFSGDHEQARRAINSWVAGHTDEKIAELLPKGSVDEKTRMAVVNTVLLKAGWDVPFDKKRTKKGEFRTADGRRQEVQFMHKTEKFLHFSNDIVSVVTLPFRGGKLALTLIMPNGTHELAEAERQLASAAINGRGRNASLRIVELRMPKLTLSKQVALKTPLVEMGMRRGFEKSADFSGMMIDPGLFVSGVFHKVAVVFDEKGAEATAATAITGVVPVSNSNEGPVLFTLDRPFLFIISHAPTDSILFAGRVSEVVGE